MRRRILLLVLLSLPLYNPASDSPNAALALSGPPPAHREPAGDPPRHDPTADADPPTLPDQSKLPDLSDEAEVRAAVERLEQPTTRMAALEQLIDLGGIHLFRVGSVYGSYADVRLNTMALTAAEAVRKYRDFNTVRAALRSCRPRLQFWALWNLPLDPKRTDDHWHGLLPRIRELAEFGSPEVRGRAQERLQFMRGEREFRARLAKTESL